MRNERAHLYVLLRVTTKPENLAPPCGSHGKLQCVQSTPFVVLGISKSIFFYFIAILNYLLYLLLVLCNTAESDKINTGPVLPILITNTFNIKAIYV